MKYVVFADCFPNPDFPSAPVLRLYWDGEKFVSDLNFAKTWSRQSEARKRAERLREQYPVQFLCVLSSAITPEPQFDFVFDEEEDCTY